MYLPGEDLTTFTTRVIGKPHADTPAELARLQSHIREAGNARTAQQDGQRAATEQALTPEQVQQQGCDWLGLSQRRTSVNPTRKAAWSGGLPPVRWCADALAP